MSLDHGHRAVVDLGKRPPVASRCGLRLALAAQRISGFATIRPSERRVEVELDWPRYKARCDRADVWSRWMLEQMIELLADQPLLARPLREALDGVPLPKPADHLGAAATDMFALNLDAASVAAVIALVDQAAASGARTSGTKHRGLGGFAEAWREHQRFIIGKQEG